MTMEIITQPDEPVPSLDEVKNHLGVDHDDDNDDITSKIWGAITEFEDPKLGWLGTAVVARQLRLSVDEFSTCIEIEQGPVLVDDDRPFVVKYDDENGDEQTLSDTVYRLVDPDSFCARVILKSGQSWPSTYDQEGAVKIEYWSGYDSEDIRVNNFKSAVKLHVEMTYDGRTEDQFKISETIRRLLQPYHRPVV